MILRCSRPNVGDSGGSRSFTAFLNHPKNGVLRQLAAAPGHQFTRTVEDDDLLSYFTTASRGFFRELVFRNIERYEPTYEVSREDIRDRDLDKLSAHVGVSTRH